MKHLLMTATLVASAAYAAENAKIVEPEKAEVEQTKGHQEWPSLDEWANAEKLKEGQLSAEVLLGYEYADQSGNGLKTANALLSRTRVSYEIQNDEGFGGKILGQYVAPINDHFSPEDPAYDTVADPESFRLHEAYLSYTGYDTLARVGSQEIILDNARFIGNVGWRFNAQSFNAGLVKNDSIESLTLLYAYADSINATDGDINHTRQYHLMNGEYKLGENNRVSAFAYLQRNNGSADIDTFGARFWGKNESFEHNAMLAFQRDAYYGSLSGMLDLEAADIELGAEYISGGDSSREQFQTLNGTAHAFNGWADVFLGTGAGLPLGLVDVWLKGIVTPSESLDLIAVYHYFNTAASTPAGTFSGNLGNEIDAMVKYKVCKNFDALTGAAFYMKGESGSPTPDKTVFWIRGTLRF
ncbi:alginate export family protein [Pontiella agarivorans]|uniref:Alginate export domain-containing protein n=1 Tax=Pontiella agarivorans TaxID=3038953 RepID=A0ABU5MYV5_9BACT|nr:alginate export family protein [Pontiella agarivorans]MDZ8119395.1 hypothetical protein [Pontiella agarivorans]